MIEFMLLAILNGMLVGTSRAINSRLSTYIGAFKASFWNHMVGFIFLALMLLILGGFKFNHIHDIPVYTFLGGFFGALNVAISSYVIPRIGALKAILLVISGQMITSVLLGFKTNQLSSLLAQLVGVTIILVGIYLANSHNSKCVKICE